MARSSVKRKNVRGSRPHFSGSPRASAAPIAADSSGSRVLSSARASASGRSPPSASFAAAKKSGSPERQLTRLTARTLSLISLPPLKLLPSRTLGVRAAHPG
ncbi:hypothetical protein GCM10010343_19970 [Streptomyces avidinii]|nr:hypothetical protein GCM10010343_19970 [Streptomyces avidinii]